MARPDDGELSISCCRDIGPQLSLRRLRVDPKLPTEGAARGVVPLAEDPVVASVLMRALPDDDEVSAVGRSDGRRTLAECGEGVDLELGTERVAQGPVWTPLVMLLTRNSLPRRRG